MSLPSFPCLRPVRRSCLTSRRTYLGLVLAAALFGSWACGRVWNGTYSSAALRLTEAERILASDEPVADELRKGAIVRIHGEAWRYLKILQDEVKARPGSKSSRTAGLYLSQLEKQLQPKED